MASRTCGCSSTATCASSSSSNERAGMNIPESWPRAFCNPPISGEALAEKLTMAGLEVEDYRAVGAQFSGVVVGEIVAVDKHPGADKLTLCKVYDGTQTVPVVCGAPNVRKGMKAPF